MKRRIILLLTVLCIMLMTACSPPLAYVYFHLSNVPENAEVLFLIPDTDGETYRTYDAEKDKERGIEICPSESFYYPESKTLTLPVGEMDSSVRYFCKNTKSCRIAVNGKQSQMFSLIPTDKFGYPQNITYDAETDTFTPTKWVPKTLFGKEWNTWDAILCILGYIGTGISVIVSVILAIVSHVNLKPAPWKTIWIYSCIFTLPHVFLVVLMTLEKCVPYFNMDGSSVTLNGIKDIIGINAFWILYMVILWVCYRFRNKEL